jgi:transcriptional regulator with XRE-family HTH domain
MAKKIPSHRLIRNRKLAGLSRVGAARLLGITPTQLTEWERGKRMPSPKFLFKMEVLYQRLISDMYYEQRQEAIKEIEENRRIYGHDGLGTSKEQPP